MLGGFELIRPTVANRAPVLQRFLVFLSLQSIPTADGKSKIAIVIDPAAVIWNPYNIRLEFDAFKIGAKKIPLEYSIEVEPGVDSDTAPVNQDWTRLEKAAQNSNRGADDDSFSWLYFVANRTGTDSETQAPVILEPGEMRVFTLTNNSPQPFNSNLYAAPGWNIGSSGGVYFDRILGDNENNLDFLELKADDEVKINVRKKIADHFYLRSYLVSQNRIVETNQTDDPDHLRDPELQETEFDIRTPSSNFSPLPSYLPIDLSTKINFGVVDLFLNPLSDPGNSRRYPSFASSSFLAPIQFYRMSNKTHSGFETSIGWNITIDDSSGFIPPFGLALNNNRSTWGPSFTDETGDPANGQYFVAASEAPTTPLRALAGLQHAGLALTGYQPLNAIGNSLASPLIQGDSVAYRVSGKKHTYPDLSFLSNEALWDNWFFSGIAPEPDEDGDYPQAIPAVKTRIESRIDNLRASGFDNGIPSLRFLEPPLPEGVDLETEWKDPVTGPRVTAATTLRMGAFNVNSVAEKAWTYFLSGLQRGDAEYYNPETGALAESPALNFASRFDLPAGDASEAWRGFRDLTPTQIQNLAEAIVERIRAEGPFSSLSEFINRRPASGGPANREGLLGRAIAASGINSLSLAPPDNLNFPFPAHIPTDTAQGIPGHLTQADLLTIIGPFLAVRSDTFRIRGRADDAEGRSLGCEIIVQRVPSWVSPQEDAPWDDPTDVLNQTFGRGLQIVSLRWIPQAEL